MYSKFIESTLKLIAIDSVETPAVDGAPFGKGVSQALDFALSESDKLGFKTVNGDGYYGYAELGEGELIAMLGHLDVVPIGKHWTKPALGLIENGVMYGRGVLDDKAPILACLFATAELVAEGHMPRARVRIIFGCDEESGWKCMDKYLEREELPKYAFTPDGDFPVINCEKGIVYYDVSLPMGEGVLSMQGGDRANMVMDSCEAEVLNGMLFTPDICSKYDVTITGNTLSAKGKSAHGSTPFKGDNAMFKVIKALAHVYGGEWEKLYFIINNTDGSGYGIKLSDEVSGKLTINVGTCLTDCNKLHFSLDIRYPISFTRANITKTLQENLKGYNVVEGFYHEPLYIDKSHELVVKLLDAYEEVMGVRPEPLAIGGGTYARAFPTAVAFGPIFPGQESTIHQADEQVSLDELKKMYDIFKVAIKKLAFEN